MEEEDVLKIKGCYKGTNEIKSFKLTAWLFWEREDNHLWLVKIANNQIYQSSTAEVRRDPRRTWALVSWRHRHGSTVISTGPRLERF